MRLLLDESVPSRLRRTLPNHAVCTAGEMGWSGIKNGKLLARLASFAAGRWCRCRRVGVARSATLQRRPSVAQLLGALAAPLFVVVSKHWFGAAAEEELDTAEHGVRWSSSQCYRSSGSSSS